MIRAAALVFFVGLAQGQGLLPSPTSGGAGAGGTGCVPAGTIGQLLEDGGDGTCPSIVDFVFATHTLAVGAAGILDLHAAATSALKVPGGFTTGVVHVTTTTGATAGGLVSLTADVSGVLPTANIAVALANQTSLNGVTMASAVGDATIAQVIAHGATAMVTGALAANTCASATTVGATGVATTDVITFTPNADVSAAVGYGAASTDGLKIYPYPTSGNVNFKVCNGTGTSITVPALTANWKVIR